MPPDKRRIDVMVSSTSSDLQVHRDKARDAILRVGWYPEMMEHDGAAPESALERSLRYVDEADIYILILGFRYGSIPKITDNPKRLSYTELEYHHALERQAEGELTILTFLMDENHPRTVQQIESDPEKLTKLKAFRAEVSDAANRGVSAFFTSPDSLYAEVLDSLHNQARQRYAQTGPVSNDNVLEHYLTKTLPDSILEVGSIANLGLLDKSFVELSADVRQQTAITPVIESVLDDPDLDIGGDYVPIMALQGAIYAPREHDHYGKPEYIPDIRTGVKALKRVVILGEPGAGKTFTLARLALDYLNAYREDANAPIPVFVPLSTYRTMQDFEAFIDERLKGFSFREHKVVWLLDALNEMPREHKQWEHLKAFIHRLVSEDAPFVITCRVRNYEEELRDIPDLYRVDLQDLNPRQIFDILTHFIGVDYAAQVWEGVMYGVYRDYRKKTNLLEAWDAWDGSVHDFWERPKHTRDNDEIKRAHLSVRAHIHSDPRKLMLLCRNPFTLVRLLVPRIREAARIAKQTEHDLITLLSQTLPNNRAQLFGQVVDGMLNAEAERKKWTTNDLAAIQFALAFTAIALQTTEQRTEMLLSDLVESENVPDKLVQCLKMARDAGIITLSDTTVRFNHQLYQEYFATKKLRDLLADYTERHPDWEVGEALPPCDARLSEIFPDWWDAGGWRVTVALLGELEGRTGISRVVRWLASYTPSIALEILVGENNDGVTVDDLNDEAKQALIASANARKSEINPIGRAAAYRVLGLFDADHRPGVGVFVRDGVKLPDIDWVRIPAGEFIYGDNNKDDYSDFSEPADRQILSLNNYEIARYPITYVQFQTFIDDPEGYSDRDRWFEGLVADDDDRQVGDQYFKYANHPRDSVNWYQAIAFCRWYSWRLGGGYDLDAVEQWFVRLPTEFEWEKAARANTGWRYPYSDDFDPSKGNTDETGIGQASAVGIFPSGDTPHWEKPISDVSGNVWEWCLTEYKKNPQMNPLEENLRSDGWRVLRGGSWGFDQGDAHAVSRELSYPANRSDDIGFRVVRAPSQNR